MVVALPCLLLLLLLLLLSQVWGLLEAAVEWHPEMSNIFGLSCLNFTPDQAGAPESSISSLTYIELRPGGAVAVGHTDFHAQHVRICPDWATGKCKKGEACLQCHLQPQH